MKLFKNGLTFVILCAIWYRLYNSKKRENIHGVVLLLINTPPWVFFTFFKLSKWYHSKNAILNYSNLQFLALLRTLSLLCFYIEIPVAYFFMFPSRQKLYEFLPHSLFQLTPIFPFSNFSFSQV